MKLEELRSRAEKLGLHVDTWSPGDGVTRYRFFADGPRDYFEADGVYTALGHKEVKVFLRGVEVGRQLIGGSHVTLAM